MPRTYEPTTLGQITETLYRIHITDRARALGIRERDLAAHLELAAAAAAIARPVDIHPTIPTLWTGTQAAA